MTARQTPDKTNAVPPQSVPVRISALRLPADLTKVRARAPQINSLLAVLLAEARCTLDQQMAVYVASTDDATDMLVPWLGQTLSLPLRAGEKVLTSLHLPSIRLTPMARSGVLTKEDALGLLKWVRLNEPSCAIVFTDVPIDTALYAAVLEAHDLGYVLVKNEPDSHLFHRFRDGYASFMGELSSKYRNQLRKKEKVFSERVGTVFELKEYRLAEDVKCFLAAASAINKKTYQFRLFGESVDNDNATVEASQRAALGGAFRSFILWHGSVPLCFVLGHQRADGTYEHRKTGYDPEWRDIAPGIICNLLMLRRLYESDRPQVLDFGSGDSDYKRLFANETCMTANPVLIPRRPKYMVALWLFRVFTVVNDSSVRVLDRLGLKEWIKRRLRRAA
jgi:Acetyltransferase (GNAT) domain